MINLIKLAQVILTDKLTLTALELGILWSGTYWPITLNFKII